MDKEEKWWKVGAPGPRRAGRSWI